MPVRISLSPETAPELLSGLDLRSFYNMHQYGAPLDSVFLDMQVRNESNSIPVILRITSAIKIIQKGRFTAPFMLWQSFTLAASEGGLSPFLDPGQRHFYHSVWVRTLSSWLCNDIIKN